MSKRRQNLMTGFIAMATSMILSWLLPGSGKWILTAWFVLLYFAIQREG